MKTPRKKEPRRKMVQLEVLTTLSNAELRALVSVGGLCADGEPWALRRLHRGRPAGEEGLVQVTVNDVQGDR